MLYTPTILKWHFEKLTYTNIKDLVKNIKSKEGLFARHLPNIMMDENKNKCILADGIY